MSAQLSFVLGALGALVSVILGAFGAHALKGRLDDYSLGVFDTAVQYQFYHSLALLIVALVMLQVPASTLLRSSSVLFALGIVVFSGSLYVLSLTGIRWLGAVTPLGGLAFIAGWTCLAAAGWKLLGS